MINLILLIAVGFFALVLILYYLLIFTKLASYKPAPDSNCPPVSVIIAAKNERKNLEVFLPKILNQDYPEFEVIVVNDGSFDGTSDLLKEMKLQYSKLRTVDLNLEEQYQKGKKFALTMGIKAAKHEQLLFTDADCDPASEFWIKRMMERGDRPIVLGYAPHKTKNTPLGAMVFYETFHTALQYLSYALKGMPYMGVGRNLSYPKTLFFKNKGFASHQHLLSGDDDLFIQEVATQDNVAICIEPESFMQSAASKGFGAWVRQKQRHISTSDLYKFKYKFLLGFYSFSHVMFYTTLILNIFFKENWIIAGSILGLKWIIQWIVFYKPSKMLNAKTIGYLLPLYDLYYTFILLILGIVKPFYKNKTWK
ncbi:glycosyltransferase [bacterium]|nr:glycosyltransferase [bacterium]